jgi:predicted double-glycine peptidase
VSPTTAFLVIASFLALGSTLAYLCSRRGGKWGFILATGASFLGVGGQLACAWRPDVVAPLIEGTDLALLYPGLGYAFGVVLLFALAPRTGRRNGRAVLFLGGFLAALTLWNASGLLGDLALRMGSEKGWIDDCCLQSTPWSCAPAAACSLLRRLGIEAEENEMVRLMRARPTFGTDLLNMQRGIESKLAGGGHRVELRRLDYDGLVAARSPCLAPIKLRLFLDHAVMVADADATGVSVLDPLRGRRRLARAQFEAAWKRQALFVLPRPRE